MSFESNESECCENNLRNDIEKEISKPALLQEWRRKMVELFRRVVRKEADRTVTPNGPNRDLQQDLGKIARSQSVLDRLKNFVNEERQRDQRMKSPLPLVATKPLKFSDEIKSAEEKIILTLDLCGERSYSSLRILTSIPFPELKPAIENLVNAGRIKPRSFGDDTIQENQYRLVFSEKNSLV